MVCKIFNWWIFIIEVFNIWHLKQGKKESELCAIKVQVGPKGVIYIIYFFSPTWLFSKFTGAYPLRTNIYQITISCIFDHYTWLIAWPVHLGVSQAFLCIDQQIVLFPAALSYCFLHTHYTRTEWTMVHRISSSWHSL